MLHCCISLRVMPIIGLVPVKVSASPTQHLSMVTADHHRQLPIGAQLHLDPCLVLDQQGAIRIPPHVHRC